MPSNKKERSLKKKYSSFFRDRRDIPEPEPELENSMEGTCPSRKQDGSQSAHSIISQDM